MSEKRVLPAEVFDALQMSAAMYGGIGAFDRFTTNGVPICYVGHLEYAGLSTVPHCDVHGERYGIAMRDNDHAVANIARRHGQFGDSGYRATFEEWANELGVCRGEEVPAAPSLHRAVPDAAPPHDNVRADAVEVAP